MLEGFGLLIEEGESYLKDYFLIKRYKSKIRSADHENRVAHQIKRNETSILQYTVLISTTEAFLTLTWPSYVGGNKIFCLLRDCLR